MTERIDFSRLPRNIWSVQSRRKRMRYFRCQTTKLKFQMTVWDIGTAPSKGKKEGERVTTKIFPRVFQPDEEASPEVGQPKRPKRSAWETNCRGKGTRENDSSSPSICKNPRVSVEKVRDPFTISKIFLVSYFYSRFLSPAIRECKNTRIVLQ